VRALRFVWDTDRPLVAGLLLLQLVLAVAMAVEMVTARWLLSAMLQVPGGWRPPWRHRSGCWRAPGARCLLLGA
jgi:hypothetical protein